MNIKSKLWISIFILVSCNNDTRESKVQATLKAITESVYASATVVSADLYKCRPVRSGIIEAIYVEEGDEVVAGQALFKISTTPDIDGRIKTSEINLEEAKSNYYSNNNTLKSIELEIETVTKQNKLDSVNYHRILRLWDQNIGSRNKVDQALLAYQSTSAKLEGLRKQLQQTKEHLEHQLQRAQVVAKADKASLNDFVVNSEISGRVYSIMKETGELINSQEVFAEVGSQDAFIVQMDIDESDIVKVELGDTALIVLEALPEQVFTTKINYISSRKTELTQTFDVEGVFLNPPPKLFHGLSGEANIVIARRKNAMVLPTEYIFDGNRVVTDTGVTELQLGVKNLQYVEVLSGIDTSTQILKPE